MFRKKPGVSWAANLETNFDSKATGAPRLLGQRVGGSKTRRLLKDRLKARLMMLLAEWKEIIVDFCQNTTIHGLNHVVAPRLHPMERLFWVVSVVAATYGAGLLCKAQLTRYTSNPTVVSIKKDFREWSTTFPAVTVCLTDRVDEIMAEDYIKLTWNVSRSDEDRFEYYSGFIRLVASVSFRSNLRLFWKYEHDATLAGVELMAVAVAVSPNSGLSVSLHEPGHVDVWVPVMTEMGICKTFNSVFSRYQSVETWLLQQETPDAFAGIFPEEGLLSCHYMGRQCSAKLSIINSTGTYYVHSPWEIAETTSTSLGPVEDGQEVEGVFKALQVRSGSAVRGLARSQRGCRYPSEEISSTVPAYSNALCQIDCRSRMSIVFCGCRPFFYIVGNGKPCDARGMACLGRSMEILINLPTNLAKCACVPQCTEINYVPRDQRTTLWNSSYRTIFDRRASVRVELQMPKVIMHKDVIFTFEDLISSFGGVSALCLGVSFISFVEILACLFKPFLFFFLRTRKNTILDYAN